MKKPVYIHLYSCHVIIMNYLVLFFEMMEWKCDNKIQSANGNRNKKCVKMEYLEYFIEYE